MACIDCFSNCGEKRTTDRCVQYTGVDIPALGICNGDSLYQLEVIILEKLQQSLTAVGIDLSDLSIDCAFVEDILGDEDKNVFTLIKALVTGECTLRELIQDIQDELAIPFSVSAPCLTLPASPTRDDILKAAVIKLCTVSTDVAAIKTDYVKASQLCAAVAVCLAPVGIVQEYTKMPKYIALPYLGPLTVFDGTGKGLSVFGYDKVYICNGNNGTQDMRGRVAVGANTNVVGPALDAAVDPALAVNAGYNISQNTKKGTYVDTLTTPQIPAHTHGVTDSGHTHNLINGAFAGNDGRGTAISNSGSDVFNWSGGRVNTGIISTAVTGITIQSTGGGQPHNTTQPSFGVVWVIYLP